MDLSLEIIFKEVKKYLFSGQNWDKFGQKEDIAGHGVCRWCHSSTRARTYHEVFRGKDE